MHTHTHTHTHMQTSFCPFQQCPWCRERWGQKEKRASEDAMARWQSLMQLTWTWADVRRWWGTGTGTGCSLWCHKEPDITEWLNNNIHTYICIIYIYTVEYYSAIKKMRFDYAFLPRIFFYSLMTVNLKLWP